MLYAHHKNLDYFSTECIYSPEAFRGSARALIKNLERIRPSAILDIVRSGEDMAKLVPGNDAASHGPCTTSMPTTEEETGGCGSANGRSSRGEMVQAERQLAQSDLAAEQGLETEVSNTRSKNGTRSPRNSPKQLHIRYTARKPPAKQVMGQCKKCGYLSSQEVCKACTLLEGLNRNRPKHGIEVVGDESIADETTLVYHVQGITVDG